MHFEVLSERFPFLFLSFFFEQNARRTFIYFLNFNYVITCCIKCSQHSAEICPYVETIFAVLPLLHNPRTVPC